MVPNLDLAETVSFIVEFGGKHILCCLTCNFNGLVIVRLVSVELVEGHRPWRLLN